MKIIIKNMVGPSSKQIVKEALDKLAMGYTYIGIGEVELDEEISAPNYKSLKRTFKLSGLELLHDRKCKLVESIKILIFNMVHHSDELPLQNYSVFISTQLKHNYTYLANVFSECEEITIEHYIIAQKIEKVKVLLVINNLSLTQISFKMHYCSVAHLSNQFKKITNMTPTSYKNKMKMRTQLEE